MDLFTILSEDKIKTAIKDGEFKNLPGLGKYFELEDLSHIPEELRVGYKMMKNAGMINEADNLKKEINTIEKLMDACNDEAESSRLKQELTEKSLKLDRLFKKRKALNTPASAFYKEKIYNKLK
ncbi:DnaJ family domain-containing protein [Metabacillus arenae]|uniref:DUF1992 domain-containing protein n=1 Tax=Metabacillus arenae TaxID=2771434 RepID=A0A926RW56_9BACI|nr:DUF1992 domain-containing protein [Metabacillus arenae]MBD1379591.1 DUF1992 domain-containing protein [Metabacillus arenae]